MTRCQLSGCSADLTYMSAQQRQAHYDSHFNDSNQKQFEASSSSGPSNAETASKAWVHLCRTSSEDRKIIPAGGNVFWHSSQSSPPPPNFSPGLIPVVKNALIKSHSKGYTQRAWLCFDRVAHVYGEQFDRSWGCGYRNFLMACTALMVQSGQPMYFPLLDDPTPPGVRNLQSCIQDAWSKGFDAEGAKELKHQLVGTRKWIGTAELYVAFTFRGIPARLVDFDLSKRGRPEILLEWVAQYFFSGVLQPKQTNAFDVLRGAQAVVDTDRMPLILQHAGHSRTIVGYEQCKNSMINLLVFDPSRRIPADIRRVGILSHTAAAAGGTPDKFHQVLHPVQTTQTHKRKASHRLLNDPSKRMRAAASASRPGQDVIVVSDDDDDDDEKDRHELGPDPSKVLRIFRLSTTTLRRKDKYQILYFPLEDPLTESERRARRVVTSAVVR
ncbi:peptidase family C78-domain-containing protein [Sparassis latifolia]